MLRIVGTLWIIAATIIFSTIGAQADQRVALVIGNSNYLHLENPVSANKDAHHVASALDKLGYQVFHLNNLNASSLFRMVSMFANQADGAKAAIVYYAGYGVEEAGQTYLVPIDAQTGVTASTGGFVKVTELTQTLAEAGVHSTFLLDIAYRNSVAAAEVKTRGLVRIGLDNAQPAVGATLAPTPTQANELKEPAVPVLVAGKPGNGLPGLVKGHSPFAALLVKALNEPQIRLATLASKIRNEVRIASRDAMQPYVLGKIPAVNVALNNLEATTTSTPTGSIRNSLIIQSASGDYAVNDLLSIYIKTAYDCHLTLFNIDQSTNAVTMVFPNKFQRDARISGRSIVQFPSHDAPFQMRLPQAGTEKFVALCSVEPDPFGLANKFRGGAFTSIDRNQFDAFLAHARKAGDKDVLMGQLKVSVK